MELLVATDRRYFLQDDGSPCCSDGSRGYGFWARYLDVFDAVKVVARLKHQVIDAGFPVEGDRVSLVPLNNYIGPSEYIRNRSNLKKQIFEACREDAAYLLRVPGYVGSLMQRCLSRQGRPFSLEVVADPRGLFAPGACDHLLRPLIRWDCIRQLREQCHQAASTAYVTEITLQSYYPPGKLTYVIGCSDVEMPEDAYVPTARSADSFGRPSRLVFVGTMSQLYKGVHVLIDAAAQCIQAGVDLNLTIVGDGKHQPDMEARCRENGIADRVQFLGRQPAGEKVRIVLDQADLCVLPSYTEGLPRILIEAMGRALPCIGSDVGGIPELLGPDNIVPARQVKPLANKIIQMLASPLRMARESRRNLDVARRYHADLLGPRRREFYQHIRDLTQVWVSQKAA